MHRSPPFLLRRWSLDATRWLGSWRLSIVLMVLAAFYYLFLAAWSLSSPAPVVRNIASLAPFWLVYGLLLANTAVCLLGARLRQLRRQLAPGLSRAAEPPDWRGETAPGLAAAEVGRRLRRRGYRVRPDGSDGLLAVRSRWAPLGTYLFHGSLFLLALGFFLTLATRQEVQVWAAVGELFGGEPEQVLTQSPPRRLAMGVPLPPFQVVEITPAFWRDQLLFTTLEARLAFPDGGHATTRINWPLWLGWSTFLRLSGFGYTPRWELVSREGLEIDSAFVKLNVFPPGRRDFFQLPDYPHRFYVEVLPDFAVENGEAVTRSLNLANPAVRLQVTRGRLDLGEAVLRQGDTFGFEGLGIRFPEIRYWGQFSIVRDPGAPLVFLGYLVGLLGLALKVRGGRREAQWRPGAAGEGGTLAGWGGGPPPWLAAAGDDTREAAG